MIIEPLSNQASGDFMDSWIAQISRKPPPISRQAGNVRALAPGKRLTLPISAAYLSDAACLIGLTMVPMKNLIATTE